MFFSPSESHVQNTFVKLREQKLEFEVEDDVAGFLGIAINKLPNGTLELLQTGLIDRVISALGLEGANQKSTPAEKGALGSDKDGDLANGTFNYASAIGMAMYLARNSRPDIAFAVHQCAQ